MNYTEEELVYILEGMYNQYTPKPLGIHLFGIKYGQYIMDNNINAIHLIEKSNIIKRSYYTELRKGIILSSYVSFLK